LHDFAGEACSVSSWRIRELHAAGDAAGRVSTQIAFPRTTRFRNPRATSKLRR